MRSKREYNTVVTVEPDIAIGEAISFAIATVEKSDAENVAKFVNNWGALKGALLAVVYVEKQSTVVGAAFFAAPGLAVSATHVFADRFDDLAKGHLQVVCVGIREDEAQLWRIEKINHCSDNDICLLSLSPISSIPKDRIYYQFPLTTRTPKCGEKLNLVGFRHEPYDVDQIFKLSMNMIASVGVVTAVYPEKRDRISVCYPAIEIQAGSLGGMSGGVAVDDFGHVVGVVSRGFDGPDRNGPTYASWIINALNRPTEISWPRGLYNEPTAILGIDPKMVALEGREAIERWDDNTIHFRVWFDKGAT